MESIAEISIIGTGALGGTLTRAFSGNFSVVGLYNRSPQKLKPFIDEIKPRCSGTFPRSVSEIGDACFITVPDGQIQTVTNRLAALKGDLSERIIVHCSGNKSSSVLSPVQERGAFVASFHPLQTFTAASEATHLSGIYYDIEGDSKAVVFLKELATMLGSESIEINPEAKPYLHASAVMASNYLVALLESSSAIAELGGISKQIALKALLPLVQQTLQNSTDSDSLTDALSGPIARGDVSTVQEHISLLEPKPRVAVLYKKLGLQTLELAREGRSVEPDKYQKMLKLFEE